MVAKEEVKTVSRKKESCGEDFIAGRGCTQISPTRGEKNPDSRKCAFLLSELCLQSAACVVRGGLWTVGLADSTRTGDETKRME